MRRQPQPKPKGIVKPLPPPVPPIPIEYKINSPSCNESKINKSCGNCIFFEICHRRKRTVSLADAIHNESERHEIPDFIISRYKHHANNCDYYVTGTHGRLIDMIARLNEEKR